MAIYRANNNNDWVQLTPEEIAEAIDHGRELARSAKEKKRKNNRSAPGAEWTHMIGAMAEQAAAKYLGVPWEKRMNSFKGPDLLTNIEVRLIGVNTYGLRIYPNDNDERFVVGVVIEKGKEQQPYRIPGWFKARLAKREDWIMNPGRDDHPFYAVPQEELYPIDLLKKFMY